VCAELEKEATRAGFERPEEAVGAAFEGVVQMENRPNR
jgi:hypothetical protein